MSSVQMQLDEFLIHTDLVYELMKEQFPRWTEWPLEVIKPEETDNKMHRLGNDMIIRLPRMKQATVNIKKESRYPILLLYFL